jgi:hypothetical protein
MPQRYEFALSLPPVPSVQGVPKKQIPLARNFSGSFEDEHDEDEEDASAEALAKEDLVADSGVRLRRAQSSRSVERYAAL